MNRWVGALLAVISLGTSGAQGQLPKQEESQPLEIEPPLLIHNRGSEGAISELRDAAVPVAQIDLAKLESNLTRARKSAAGVERLYKRGIISKVEAEDRALKVVRLEASLATAQLEVAKSKMEERKSETVTIAVQSSVAERKESEETLAQAARAAERADNERRRAELDSAFKNLQRQQKLLALGFARKADVNRAEQKLADLQRVGN